MKTTNYLSKETNDGQAIAAKIHATAATLTELIREAREKKIVVHLDNASGFSVSNGLPLTAKITATIVFGEEKPVLA